MFDVELEKACHLFETKKTGFIMEQGGKMDATLRAMKALIVSLTKLFPTLLESSKDGEISSSYSNLSL